MAHRDPETGQFVADSDQYSDIEVATFNARLGVEAANLGGATGLNGELNQVEGLEVIDYDEFVDRNEELRLLDAHHRLVAYINSTETEDGALAVTLGVQAQPGAGAITSNFTDAGSTVSGDVVGEADTDDSIDFIGRPLRAMAGAPFSDTSTGVGGGGSQGEDSVRVNMAPAEFGRFHPRDELFLAGHLRAWNIDDAAIHAEVQGQHVYGVVED